MGKYGNISTFGLIARFIKLVKAFVAQEKSFVKKTFENSAQKSLPGVALACAGLVFIAISGIFLLVTAVLVLNLWFVPWASALIVSMFLMLCGLVLGLTGLLKVKKGVSQARVNLNLVKEDMKWLKKS